MLNIHSYQQGFEEDEQLRSFFVRALTLGSIVCSATPNISITIPSSAIPKTIMRFWHDLDSMPNDVRTCLGSWEQLRQENFEFKMFNDASAITYIQERYSSREAKAFTRCRHPAMRSDYFRMCFVLAEGGLYVDTDEVLLGDGWKSIFWNDKLKIQPLCYDIPSGRMIPSADIWRADLPTEERIFYVNNNPIAAPPDHPLLQRALARSTGLLLGDDLLPEIQATTGPGNFTASLVAHAHRLLIIGEPLDFEMLRNWETIAETRWELSYRHDARNWCNMDTH